MTSNPIFKNNDELVLLITETIVQKFLASFDGERVGYRRLRWVACSRTNLTKREANQVLLLLIKKGLIATTKPQANSERMAWLTPQGLDFLHQHMSGGE